MQRQDPMGAYKELGEIAWRVRRESEAALRDARAALGDGLPQVRIQLPRRFPEDAHGAARAGEGPRQ